MNFTFNTTKKIIFKAGALKEVATYIKNDLATPLLIVTDKGMVAAGLVKQLCDALDGINYVLYDNVIADPPESIIFDATEQAKAIKAKAIIGFGGGSSLDVAKLVAVLALGKENLSDIYGIGNIKGKRLPLMLIPTTAGTGSEVTPISIVTTGKTTKMGVVSPVLLPDVALLDPELTYNLPSNITAATGIDAMVHAIEAYTSRNANNNPISKSLAREALRLMGPALPLAVAGIKSARASMFLGSLLAGQAFANSPVSAVHALAYPLGGVYKLPHGLTNALVLPHVVRFNESHADYSLLCEDLFGQRDNFAARLAELSMSVDLMPRLRDYNIPHSDLPMLAYEAMKQTRLLVNNPRDVREVDALAIYSAAW